MSEIKTCSCCREDQLRCSEDPRELYEVPKSHLKEDFKKSDPALLCEYCDGDAYEMVLEKEEKDRS